MTKIETCDGHEEARSDMPRANEKTVDTRGVHVWLVLYRAARSVEVHAHRSIESLGLTYSDFAVLEALFHKGPMPINTLARKVLLASGSITPAVDRLEARALVQRTADPGDRRVRTVELTPAGKTLIRAGFADHEIAMEQVVASLSEKERATIVRLLKQLGKGAEAMLESGEKNSDEEKKKEAVNPAPAKATRNATKARNR